AHVHIFDDPTVPDGDRADRRSAGLRNTSSYVYTIWNGHGGRIGVGERRARQVRARRRAHPGRGFTLDRTWNGGGQHEHCYNEHAELSTICHLRWFLRAETRTSKCTAYITMSKDGKSMAS